jgi:hypothetical protein
MHAQITLTEAAREGARAVALEADWQDRVDTATQGLGGLASVTPTVEQCGPNPAVDDDARVTVDYTFSFVTPVGALAGIFGGSGFGGDVQLSAEGVMPCRA